MSAQLSYIDVTDDRGHPGVRSGLVKSDQVDTLDRVDDSIRMYALDAPEARVVSFQTLNRLLGSTADIVQILKRYVMLPATSSWMPDATPMRGSYWLAFHRDQLQALDGRAAGSVDSLIDVWSRNLGPDSVLVEVKAQREQVAQLVGRLQALRNDEAHAPKQAAEPKLPPETAAAARRRQELAENWVGAADVSALMGSTATSNPSQHAMRLRKAGKILGVWVPSERGYRYPPFQFGQDGRVLPEMAELLTILPKGNGSGWSQVEWLYAPHPRLEGRRPRDVMAENPSRVLDAARRHFQGHPDARW